MPEPARGVVAVDEIHRALNRDVESVPGASAELAMRELAKQRMPRRWFSPLALSREVDLVKPGAAARLSITFWCRYAVAEARLQYAGKTR